jgi:hypothetical protein
MHEAKVAVAAATPKREAAKTPSVHAEKRNATLGVFKW